MHCTAEQVDRIFGPAGVKWFYMWIQGKRHETDTITRVKKDQRVRKLLKHVQYQE